MEYALAAVTIGCTLALAYICLRGNRERNQLIRELDHLNEENGILMDEIGDLQARLENARQRTVHR